MSDNNILSNNNGNSKKSTDQKKQVEKPIHYFNKVIRNMDNKELSKLKVIYKTEISMEFCDFDEQLINNSTNNYEMEEYFNNSESLFWIEFLENKILYSAIKELRIKDLILLDMWVNQGYTQKEIAEIFDSSENAIKMRLYRIKQKIRGNFEK